MSSDLIHHHRVEGSRKLSERWLWALGLFGSRERSMVALGVRRAALEICTVCGASAPGEERSVVLVAAGDVSSPKGQRCAGVPMGGSPSWAAALSGAVSVCSAGIQEDFSNLSVSVHIGICW